MNTPEHELRSIYLKAAADEYVRTRLGADNLDSRLREIDMAGLRAVATATRLSALEEAAVIAQKVVASWVVKERFKTPPRFRWPAEVTKWMDELTGEIRAAKERTS